MGDVQAGQLRERDAAAPRSRPEISRFRRVSLSSRNEPNSIGAKSNGKERARRSIAFEAGQRERAAGSTGARAAELISSGCGAEMRNGDAPFSLSTLVLLGLNRESSKKAFHEQAFNLTTLLWSSTI